MSLISLPDDLAHQPRVCQRRFALEEAKLELECSETSVDQAAGSPGERVSVGAALHAPIRGRWHPVAKATHQAPHRLTQGVNPNVPDGCVDGASRAGLEPARQAPDADAIDPGRRSTT
jgi:hypothetical protein